MRNHLFQTAAKLEQRLLLSHVSRQNSSSSLPLVFRTFSSQSENKKRLKRPQNTSQQTNVWVPQAYRGDKTFDYGSSPKRKGRPRRGSFRGSGASSSSTHRSLSRSKKAARKLERSKKRREDREASRLKNDTRRLIELQNGISKLAAEYRSCLRPGTDFKPIEQDIENTAELSSLSTQLLSSLGDLHDSDDAIEWIQIQESENLFCSISRALQGTTMLAAQLGRWKKGQSKAERDQSLVLFDLAELALRKLIDFRSERTILVEAVRRWKEHTASPSRRKRRELRLQQWIASLFETFPSLDLSQGHLDDSSTANEPTFGHENSTLEASEVLFRVLMDSIITHLQPTLNDGDIDEEKLLSSADRLVSLLELLPSNQWRYDSDLLPMVLKVLSQVGTLESTRTSQSILARRPAPTRKANKPNDELPVQLVLQAHLLAAKNSVHNKEELSEIVQECIQINKVHWASQFPIRRVDRVEQAAMVLQCLVVAGADASTPQFDSALGMIKRVMGRKFYDHLQEGTLDQFDDVNEIDPLSLPVLNLLVELYAVSDDEVHVVQAAEILRIMIALGNMARNPPPYPKVRQANLVLGSLHSPPLKSMSEDQASQRKKDLEFAFDVFNSLTHHEDESAWPDNETFELMFKLVNSVVPPDIGIRAEDILCRIEARQCMIRLTSNVPRTTELEEHPQNSNLGDPSTSTVVTNDVLAPAAIPLSVYHRVLRCWHRSAQMVDSSLPFLYASQRAVQILDQLELESTPLLLTQRDCRNTKIHRLYDSSLAPRNTTYMIVLKVLAAEAEAWKRMDERQQKEEASGVMSLENMANSVVERMEMRGIRLEENKDATGLLDKVFETSKNALQPESQEATESCQM